MYRDPQECYTLPFGKSRGIGVREGTGARAVGGRSQGNERRHARVTDYWSTARPFTCHSRPFRYLFAGPGFGIFFYQRQNPTMYSPQQPERQNVRYPLHLPVAVKLGHEEMQTQSENISLNGILLSSAFLIPAGSTVELAVGVAQVPSPGILLIARGKVLRVQAKASGNFAVAIECEGPFELKRRTPNSEQEA